MDGRSNPRARLACKLDVNVPEPLLLALDKQVEKEAHSSPEITRSALVRRELTKALRRLGCVLL